MEKIDFFEVKNLVFVSGKVVELRDAATGTIRQNLCIMMF